MAIITQKQADEQASKNDLGRNLAAFCSKFDICGGLRRANAYKNKGVPASKIFKYLLQLVFTMKSMYMNIITGSQSPGFGKDAVYRMLNAIHINWSAFLLWLASSVVRHMESLTDEKRLNVIAIDDTMYERSRSKKAELLAKVYDHASKGSRFKRGFRLLTLAWTDGATLIPLLFRHLSSSDRSNRYCEAKQGLDKRTIGHRIRQEAVSPATSLAIKMLEMAKKARIPARHVVFDSWFSFPSIFMKIKGTGFDAVGRLKDTSKIMYLFCGAEKTLKQIYAASKKRRGRAKCLLSVNVVMYDGDGNKAPARIVFVRDRNKRGKWIAFGTTDMSLTEEEVIQLYGKRWDIEVFFKISKTYLKLGSEFQCLSYDAMTAHTAIVMTRYIILAFDKRQRDDPRSMGELFYAEYEEVADTRFSDVLGVMLAALHETLSDVMSLNAGEVERFINAFLDKLAPFFKRVFAQYEPKAVAC